MAPAIAVKSTTSKNRLVALFALLSMAAGGASNQASIGSLFQMIIRWSIIGGGLIATAATAITAVINNFTLIETGVPALDLMITGGLVLLVGFFMIKGLISVLSPEAGKFLKV